MVNKSLFKSKTKTKTKVKKVVMPPLTVNLAGGLSYKLGDKEALAQLVVTGCLNGTFYASAESQLGNILKYADKVEPEFLAKVAMYGRQKAWMKDTPVVLLCKLSTLGEAGRKYASMIFDHVINSGKQLRNLFKIANSGQAGRQNCGTFLRKKMCEWLNNKDLEDIFRQSVGNDPTLEYVIRGLHFKPKNKTAENFYNYLMGREHNKRTLPAFIKAYEKFIKQEAETLPNVPFEMLASHNLSTEGWTQAAKSLSWLATLMNLNTFQRNGVFGNSKVVKLVAEKLRNKELINKAKVFPYKIMTALNYTENVPSEIQLALQDALDISLDNIPAFDGDVSVCVDISSSMSSPVTGNSGTASSKVKCVDVAALITSAVLRKNPSARILAFNDRAHNVNVNSRDSVWTNTNKIAKMLGGGTNCSSAMQHLNKEEWKGDLVIYVSDNMTWMDNDWGSGTALRYEFKKLQNRNKDAKLVLIDLQPSTTTPCFTSKDVLNVSGFSDVIYDVIRNFMTERTSFADEIENVSLTKKEKE